MQKTNFHEKQRKMTGISGEHKISQANERLSPYFEDSSPVSKELSPEETEDLSTKSHNLEIANTR